VVTKHRGITIEDLAAVIAGTVKGVKPARFYRVEQPESTIFDSITRTSILSRIRRLSRMYSLDWLVEQAVFNKPGLDSLEDGEISDLLRNMERARECRVDGVAFDEAGLVHNVWNDLNL
jgi:hypothetical protein